MKIGEAVVQYREEHNLSQREFARKCGLSHVVINFVERGERSNGDPYMPRYDTISKIARGMGTDFETLVQNCEDFNLDVSEYPQMEEYVRELTQQSPDESMLIQAYRLIPAEHRIEAMSAILQIKDKYEK